MEKNLVVKANKLNESRYRLSVIEQRVVLTMISLIKPRDRAFKPYSFTIKEFAELTGVTGRNSYTRLKSLTKALRKKSLTIHEPDGDLQTGWVSSVKYYDDEGRLELCFDPKLKPYLLALKKEFTRYQLKNTVRLRSGYSVRLYELLKQYQSVGKRFFLLEDLRRLLGIPEDKLTIYSNFRMRVLDKAFEELSQGSDITFEYSPVKTVRKITGINFKIIDNSEVIKASYKEKEDSKKREEQAQKDVDTKQALLMGLNARLKSLEDDYPDHYQKLKKQALKRLKNVDTKKPGYKLTIKHKMFDLLSGYIQKNKIKGV